MTIELDLVQSLASMVLVDDPNPQIDSRKKLKAAFTKFLSQLRLNPSYEERLTPTSIKEAIFVIKASLPFISEKVTGRINFQRLSALAQRVFGSYNLTATEYPLVDRVMSQLSRFQDGLNVTVVPLSRGLNRLQTLLDSTPLEFSINSTELLLIASEVFLDGLVISQNFTVASTIKAPKGKWPLMFSSVVAADVKSFEYLITSGIKQSFERFSSSKIPLYPSSLITEGVIKAGLKYLQNELNSSKHDIQKVLSQMVPLIMVVVKDKVNIYTKFEKSLSKLNSIADQIYDVLGNDSTKIELAGAPIWDRMSKVNDFKLLLNNIFIAINFVLSILCSILIYTLMIVDVHERTYEFGMLRALGLEQKGLGLLLGFQSILFYIPGVILATLMSYLFYSMASFVIFSEVGLANSWFLDYDWLRLALFWTALVTLISTWGPISKAVKKTLRESLNVYQRVISDIDVTIIKLENMGLSPTQILGSVLLVGFGFLSYYVIPLSFLLKKNFYLYSAFNIILMLLVIGFIFSINFLQPYLQKIVLAVMVRAFRRYRPLSSVIAKNLQSHHTKNKRVGLIFSLSIGFLLFGVGGFQMMSSQIIDFMRNKSPGADVGVIALPYETNILPEKDMRRYLEEYQQNHPHVIKNYSFGMQPLHKLINLKVGVGSLGKTSYLELNVRSVDEYYLGSTFSEYYHPSELINIEGVAHQISPEDHRINCLSYLYANEEIADYGDYDPNGVLAYSEDIRRSPVLAQKNLSSKKTGRMLRAIISDSTAHSLAVKVGSIFSIVIDEELRFETKVIAIVNDFPFYKIQKTIVPEPPEVLISQDDMAFLLNQVDQVKSLRTLNRKAFDNEDRFKWTSGIPKNLLHIKLNQTTTEREKMLLMNELLSFVRGFLTLVIDSRGLLVPLGQGIGLLSVFIYFVGSIGLFLAFFIVCISTWNKIQENLWEIGVLRAIGLSKLQIRQCYVVENVCVALAGGILGSVVGLTVSAQLSYLVSVFLNTSFNMYVPWGGFIGTLIGTAVICIYGTEVVLRRIEHRQIASILKG